MTTARSALSALGIGLAFSFTLALAACGGGVDTGGGGNTSSTTSAGGGGTGGTVPSGDCTTDAQCNGGKCSEVTPGGYKICLKSPAEAVACHPPGGPIDDLCCTSADCSGGGKCWNTADVPYCGGAVPAEYNACLADACQDDGGCQTVGGVQQICAPAGAFGQPVRACVVAYCKTDAACTAKPGGHCVPVASPCCSTPAGFACVYPGGCKEQSDCGNDGMQHCEIDAASHQGVCVPGPAACPA